MPYYDIQPQPENHHPVQHQTTGIDRPYGWALNLFVAAWLFGHLVPWNFACRWIADCASTGIVGCIFFHIPKPHRPWRPRKHDRAGTPRTVLIDDKLTLVPQVVSIRLSNPLTVE